MAPGTIKTFKPYEISTVIDRDGYDGDTTVYVAHLGCVFLKVSWGCNFDPRTGQKIITREEHDNLVTAMAAEIVKRLTTPQPDEDPKVVGGTDWDKAQFDAQLRDFNEDKPTTTEGGGFGV